jgi:hypothetical protein
LSNAVVIGGHLDGKTVDTVPPLSPDYALHQIDLGGTAPLLVYVHNSLTTTAAVHMVFAAYAKKGKK